jgi:hypothetical protein
MVVGFGKVLKIQMDTEEPAIITRLLLPTGFPIYSIKATSQKACVCAILAILATVLIQIIYG